MRGSGAYAVGLEWCDVVRMSYGGGGPFDVWLFSGLVRVLVPPSLVACGAWLVTKYFVVGSFGYAGWSFCVLSQLWDKGVRGGEADWSVEFWECSSFCFQGSDLVFRSGVVCGFCLDEESAWWACGVFFAVVQGYGGRVYLVDDCLYRPESGVFAGRSVLVFGCG